MPTARTVIRCGLWRLIGAILVLPAAVGLLSTCIPTEPNKPIRVSFSLSPDSVLLAIGETLQPTVSVTANDQPLSQPRLTFESANENVLRVEPVNRLLGMRRGRTSLVVTIASGALGAVDPDSTFPARIIIGSLAMSSLAPPLTAIDETLDLRPGFRDVDGDPITADSAALTEATTFSLVSAGDCVELDPSSGTVRAVTNGTDTVRATLDTSSVLIEITVEQRAFRIAVSDNGFVFRSLQESHRFGADAFDANDHGIANPTVGWRSTDASIISIADDGTATAVANGDAFLVASVEGVEDSVQVTVQQVARRTVVVSGDGQTGTVGQDLAAPFVIGVADSLDNAVAIAGIDVTFEIVAGGGSLEGAGTAVVQTDDAGQARATLTLGTSAGEYRVSASVANPVGTVAEFVASGVAAAPATLTEVSGNSQEAGAGSALPSPFVVVVRDGYGNGASGQDVAFTVTAGGGQLDGATTVTVQSDGLGHAAATLTLGPVVGDPNTVEVSSVGLTGSPITFSAVALEPVATVDVLPADDSVDVGSGTTLAATLLDANGDTIVGRPVSWSTSDDQVATVDGSGAVHGVAAGDVTITAQSENAIGSAAVAVLGAVTGIGITPDPAEVYAEDTLRLAANLSDGVGHPLYRRTVVWTSTNDALATVDSTGLVTALWPGTDTIVANAEGKADSVALTILPIPVASVAVFPGSLELYALFETADLTAQARDSVGDLINTAQFSWASRDQTVATVSQSGTVTAQNTGETYIVATSDGQSDSAFVTVVIPSQLSCDDAGVVLHDATITASETWGRGVHRVSPQLVVDGDVILTVEPGALICFGGGDNITFQNGARLDARGTPDSLIVWTGDPGNVWGSIEFTGSPSDTSYLTNALIENAIGGAAVSARDRHAVVLDSIVVRNTRWNGVDLGAPGSRLSRSVVFNTGTDGYAHGVILGDSTLLEGTTVQNSSGGGVLLQSVDVRLRNVRIENSGDVGLDVTSGSLAEASGTRVVGSGNYGVRTSLQNVPLLIPTQEAQDSLLGNARDSLLVSGYLTDATATARAGLPWRLESNLHIQSGGVLVAEPGAAFVATADWMIITVEDGARLDARGTEADSIVFTAASDVGQWNGMQFHSSAADTSYLSYTVVEYARTGDDWLGFAAVSARDQHPLVIEHSRIRASPESAIWLQSTGSRIANVVVDTTVTGDVNRPAVVLATGGVSANGLIIRGSGGEGLQMTNGTTAALSDLRVVGAASYPVVTSVENLAVWSPAAADYDSVVGNGRDTLVVYGGTVTNDTITALGSYPWKVYGTLGFNGGVFRAQPGASLAFDAGSSGIDVYNGGRLDALGSESDTVRFTVIDPNSGSWSGIRLHDPAPDTSRLEYVLIEHANSCNWDGNYNCAALQVADGHPTTVQHTRLRQNESAIWLDAPGSMLRDVVVDTTTGGTAVWLGDSTAFDSFTVRGASSWGVHIGGPLTSASGLRVTGGGDRPLVTPIEVVGLLINTAADYDGLRGNTSDILHVWGGTLRQDTVPLLADFPWYVDGGVYFDTLSMLEIEPGAQISFDNSGGLIFDNTGRLWARGTEGAPILFTGVSGNTWPGLLFQSAEGDPFTPAPHDTSYLTNVRIERTHGIADAAGIVSRQVHALIIDSALIRQSNGGAINLWGYGSRISRSALDTCYAGGWTASLSDSTTLEETVIRPGVDGGTGLQLTGSGSGSGITIRDFQILNSGLTGLDAGWSDAWIENGHVAGSGDVGFQAYGSLRQAWNVRVTGSGSYGARISIHNLGLLTETAADQDSLLGNALDTLVITGGNLQNDTVTVRADVPWLLEDHIQVDAGALLFVEPGAHVAAADNGALQFINGGRLDARGTAADSILFVNATTGGSWRGFQFENTADTSYLEYVRVQRARSIWDDSYQWAIQAYDHHPVVIRNVLIRQAFYGAVRLYSPGSGIYQSIVDTTGSGNPEAAVVLGDSTVFEATTVRASLSRGVSVDGRGVRVDGGRITNSATDGLYITGEVFAGMLPRVVGSGGYGLETTLPSLAALVPDVGTYDSLAGNARDTVVVFGDWSLDSGSAIAAAGYPWRVRGTLAFYGGMLWAEPGSRIVVEGNNDQITFFYGGRLDAYGTSADPILFTALDPSGGWGGLDFAGTPGDSSYLVNASVEYAQHWDGSFNYAAVVTREQHALIIDSSVIRQSPQSALYFSAPGSRISRSSIDTTNTTDSWRGAVWLGGATILEDVVIRRSGGEGLEMTDGTVTAVSGLTVIGTAYFPVVARVQNIGVWGATAADYDQLVGNGRDTLVVIGGTLSNDTITATASLPWLVNGGFVVDDGGLFVAEPGAAIAMSQGVAITFQYGGRLDARGTATDSIVFTSRDPSQHWASLSFHNVPSDSSYIINARIERAGEYGGGALESWGRHALILDSVLIRQAGHGGVRLYAPGSRINRSRIDTTGTLESGWTAAEMGDSTSITDVAVRGSSGVGVWMDHSVPLLEIGRLLVTGSSSYPVETSMENLAVWQPASSSYDSLVGNARDTLRIPSWGTASSGDLLVAKALPWRVESYIFVEGSAVLRAEPGAGMAFTPGQKLSAENGGRLDIHGSDTEPVLMTVIGVGDTWQGIWLSGVPSDTSRLVNVRLEHARDYDVYPDPAVYAQNPHPVVIDSSLIRQSASAVYIETPGSRFTNSVVDTTTVVDRTAVTMQGGTFLESVLVRRSAGEAFDLQDGTLAAISDLMATGGLSYPVAITPENLAVWSPTAADAAQLTGNVRDTVVVQDGTATNATIVASSSVVWRLDGDLRVGSGAVLQVEPGTHFVSANGGWPNLLFQNGGRLDAQGTAADPVVFTALPGARPWEGLRFTGSPSDTSYLINAIVEYGQVAVGHANSAAIIAEDQHPLAIDSTLIRQSQSSAVWLQTAGSRLSRSVIDTTLTSDISVEAVHVEGSATVVEAVTIRGSGGAGLQISQGQLGAVEGLRIVGAAGVPLEINPTNLAVWNPTDAAYDSLLGNTMDTLLVTGGTLSNATIRASSAIPWIVTGQVNLDAGGLFTAGPGAYLTMSGGAVFWATNTGRVDVHGSAANPAIFTGRGASGWNGFILADAPTDTSYFVHARIEHAGQDWFGSNPGAIASQNQHPVVVDSSHMFEPRGHGVSFWAPGSRITRSTITDPGWEWGGHYGAYLVIATVFDSNTVTGGPGSSGGVRIVQSDVAITNSEISGTTGDGVYVECCGLTNVTVHSSNLFDNGGYGVNNGDGDPTYVVDAANNWWGDAAGPLGTNGDGVTGNVTYSPYATTPFTITSPAPAPSVAPPVVAAPTLPSEGR